MTTYETDTACIRVDETNPDHHLYRNNGGNWWIHYLIYPDALTAERVRQSLGTKCLRTARQKRDLILQRHFPDYRSSAVQGGRS